jgi:hypothetical protein
MHIYQDMFNQIWLLRFLMTCAKHHYTKQEVSISKNGLIYIFFIKMAQETKEKTT